MFKKGIIYILLNYMIQFLNILFNLLLMKYLNSYQLGSLALAKTWQQFVDYSHLGARFSLDRYIPVAKEEEKISRCNSIIYYIYWCFICFFSRHYI